MSFRMSKSQEIRNLREGNVARGNQTQKRIFSIIAESEPSGTSTSDLRKKTGLHRDRIHTICKQYINDGLLFKTGKFGKYHLTEKSILDPSLTAQLFGDEAARIISKHKWSISSRNKFCNNDLCKNIIRHDEFCDDAVCNGIINGRDIKTVNEDIFNRLKTHWNKTDEKITKLILFEYANRIGALITYIMLEALSSYHVAITTNSSKKRRQKEEEIPLKYELKEKIACDYVSNAIKPQTLLYEFAKLRIFEDSHFDKLVKSYEGVPLDRTDYNQHLAKAKNAFHSNYPQLFEYFEQIKNGLIQDKIQWNRHSRKCSGQLGPMMPPDSEGKIKLQCMKCGIWLVGGEVNKNDEPIV